MFASLYAKLIGLGLVAIALTGLFVYGQKVETRARDAEIARDVAQQLADRLGTELETEKKNIKTVTVFVDKIRVIREKALTITKEIPIYVTQTANAACTIPDGFVWLHNDAAEGRAVPPERTGDFDASTSGASLTSVTETVTDNYRICRENSEQLKSLQDTLAPLLVK